MKKTLQFFLGGALAAFLLWQLGQAPWFQPRNGFSSVKLLPYPSGKTYALSLVDDPDGGSLDLTAPVYDFLDSIGAKVSKCVWVFAGGPGVEWGGPEYSLADPAYRKFTLKLARKGHEIAFHGASAGRDERPRIAAALEEFKKIFGAYPRMNADHSKNPENLYFGQNRFVHWPLKWLYRLYDPTPYQGEDEGSPYFWGDLAHDKIQYHRGFYFAELDTLGENPSMPYFNPETEFVRYWYSVTDGYDADMFLSRLNPKALAALKQRMSASILYTHFGYGFYDPDKKKLNPEFQKTLSALVQDQSLWLTPVSDLLDRLLLFKRGLFTVSNNSFTIRNRNAAALTEVTVVDEDKSRPSPLICVSGQGLRQVRPGVYVIDRVEPYAMAILSDAEHQAKRGGVYEITRTEAFKVRLRWLWRAVETRLHQY